MPKAVGVTYKAFCKLEDELKRWGFREITRREVVTVVIVHGLVSFKAIIEGEIGFQYQENGLAVKVWTSCVRNKIDECRLNPLYSQQEIVSRPSGTDMAWVLIVNPKNQAQYFARPVLRTKNFTKTLLQRALITLIRVQKRPLCEQCGKFMDIFRKKSRATFWGCVRKGVHDPLRPVWKEWDFALGARALKIVESWRKEYQRYLKRERAKGNEPRQARFIRKPRYVATKDPY